jgi:hypothetical protein
MGIRVEPERQEREPRERPGDLAEGAAARDLADVVAGGRRDAEARAAVRARLRIVAEIEGEDLLKLRGNALLEAAWR